MKSFASTRSSRVIAVALFALTVLTVMTGCAGAPAFTPIPLGNNEPPNNPVAATPGTPPSSTLGVAFNPKTNLLYVLKKGDVAHEYAGTVSVINQATNMVTATIPVGAWPAGVAVNPMTNTIYVTNYAGPSLSIINGATNVVTATIPNTSVGNTPLGVAVNPMTNKVYVTDYIGDLIYGMYVLDGTTGALLSEIRTDGQIVDDGTTGAQLPHLNPEDVFSVAVNTLTNTIYATTQYSVLVINGDSDKVSAIITAAVSSQGNPTTFAASGIVVDEAANVVYAGSLGGNGTSGVTVINGATNAITSTIPVGATPSSLAFDPFKHVLYVTMDKPAVVGVIDTTKDTVGTSIPLVASPADVAVNPATSLVYVTEASELAVINPAGPTTTDIPIQ